MLVSRSKWLHLFMRPVGHRETLLGMAWAFVGLYNVLAASESTELLSDEDRGVLKERWDAGAASAAGRFG